MKTKKQSCANAFAVKIKYDMTQQKRILHFQQRRILKSRRLNMINIDPMFSTLPCTVHFKIFISIIDWLYLPL